MTHYATHVGNYNEAADCGDIEKMLRAAAGMQQAGHPISARQALPIVVGLIHERDPRAVQAAVRWVQLLQDDGCEECEREIAEAALKGLASRRPGVAKRCEKALYILTTGIRE